MNISNKGLELIKSFEGCRLSAYKCPAGVWTIGYGRTNGVYEGMTITQEQADNMLREDVKYYADAVDRYNSRFNFNQAEFDSLTSFTYNCGVGSLQAVMSCCNTKQEIAEECKLYNKSSDGQILNGLVRRREEEYKLFMSGSNNNNQANNTDGYSYAEKGEYFFNTKVKIRTAPNLDNSSFTGICYDAGESVEYHTVHRNKCGYNWIQYNRGNGTQGYCAITELATGEKFGHAI
jgi:lysozyme